MDRYFAFAQRPSPWKARPCMGHWMRSFTTLPVARLTPKWEQ